MTVSDITLIHGSCKKILPTLQIPDNTLTIVDPPYNVGEYYRNHKDWMDDNEYKEWCKSWFPLLGKPLVLFPGHGNLPMWLSFAKPTGIGCWYKPGNPSSSILGYEEWEPYFYFGKRVGW